PDRYTSARRNFPNGQTSAPINRPAVGARAAASARIRTRSIAILAARAPAPARPSPQALRRSALGPRPTARSSALERVLVGRREADARSDRRGGNHSDRPQPGYRRTHGADGRRRGGAPGGAREP